MVGLLFLYMQYPEVGILITTLLLFFYCIRDKAFDSFL